MEKLEIKDFLGIKEMTIEVRQINILIGSQATGKSIVAKLLFYFKSFVVEILSNAIQTQSQKDLDRYLKKKFEEYFPSYSWRKNKFKIRYSIEKEFIEISRSSITKARSSNLILNYSEFYKDLLYLIKETIKDINNDSNLSDIDINFKMTILKNAIQDVILKEYVIKKLDRKASFLQTYIPAGRSFFANLKGNIFGILSEKNTIDPFLLNFGNYYENMKNLMNLDSLRDDRLHNEIAILNKKILCGKYFQKDGEDYLEMDEGRQINVANSSSGQQETLPLAIILETIALRKPIIGGNSIYIEEPEAHIFPAAQRDMVELIATVYNSRKDSLQFFITTHSPYILTAFNNLLQAGSLAANATEEKIKEITKILPQSRFLDLKDISVYSLSDGYATSIIDTEMGLIDTNIIDDVSNELAIQFDRLLDIDS